MLATLLALGSMAATGTAAVALGISSLVVGVYTAQHQRRQAERAARRKVQDRTVMTRSAVADRPDIFGRVRVGGQVQFLESSGTAREKLHWVLALGDRAHAITDVLFNGDSIGPLDANGWVTVGSRYWKGGTEPRVEIRTLDSTTMTLAYGAADGVAILSVFGPQQGDTPAIQFYVGNPATAQYAYSTAEVGGKTTLTFNASVVGWPITVNYTRAVGEPKARAKAFLGAPGQTADPYLLAELPTYWKASDRFTGTAYISGTHVYDPTLYAEQSIEVSVIGEFELCYDPRDTTTKWTQNPALIARRYIEKKYAATAADFEDSTFIAAANACEEQVQWNTSGSLHDRYTFDDAIPSTVEPREGLERILQAMAGSAVLSGGKWHIWAGVYEAPDAALAMDETWLDEGQIVIEPLAPLGELFNGVSGTYTDPDTGVEVPFPPYISPTYVAQDDGQQEVLDLDLSQIADVHRAQRVAKLLLHKARQALTFAAPANLKAYDVMPGRVGTWTLARYGWTAKVFRCIDRVYDLTGTLYLIWQEDAEAIYAWNYSEATTPDPAPNTNLPDPTTVPTPQLTFASGELFVRILADGTRQPFLRVYWADPLNVLVEEIEIWWRRADAPVGGHSPWLDVSLGAFDIYDVAHGEHYIVSARFRNGAGGVSDLATYSVQIDASATANSGAPDPRSENLIRNADFRDSTGWRFWLNQNAASYTPTDGGSNNYLIPGSSPQVTITWLAPGERGVADSMRPIPDGSFAVITVGAVSGLVDQGLIFQNDPISVAQGDRLEVQCHVGAKFQGGRIVLYAYDVDSNLVAALLPSTGGPTLPGYMPIQENAASNSGQIYLANFTHVWGWVDIPAGVAFVKWGFRVARGTIPVTNNQGHLVIARPSCRRIYGASQVLTPWGP